MHGWNGQQPQNAGALYGAGEDVSTVNPAPNGTKTGGHCTRAGHPCMACTEKGYPDAFVPFIARSIYKEGGKNRCCSTGTPLGCG